MRQITVMYETACQLTCDSHESPRDPVPIVFCPCIPGSTNHTDLELHPSIKRKSNPQAISGLHKNCEHACYSALVAVKLEGLGTIAPTVLPTLQAMSYKPSASNILPAFHLRVTGSQDASLDSREFIPGLHCRPTHLDLQEEPRNAVSH